MVYFLTLSISQKIISFHLIIFEHPCHHLSDKSPVEDHQDLRNQGNADRLWDRRDAATDQRYDNRHVIAYERERSNEHRDSRHSSYDDRPDKSRWDDSEPFPRDNRSSYDSQDDRQQSSTDEGRTIRYDVFIELD